MKVCLLSQSDYRSGAMISAYRLHEGLREAGIDSTILVGEKSTTDENIIAPHGIWGKGWHQRLPALDALPLDIIHRHRNKNITYHLEWIPDQIVKRIDQASPEIVHLHWINRGFLQIETLAKIKQPIVWTLHDMWAFTGGCHYSGDCTSYIKSCGTCPQLASNKDWDLSRWVWQRKLKAWKDLNLTIVTPSKWLSDCARASSLFKDFRVEVIPNGLDIQKYKPVDRIKARNILGLPLDKKLILFGASNATNDLRKGFQFLQPTLQNLRQSSDFQDQIELVIFGSSQPENPPSFGFKANYCGEINNDDSLCLLYAAADVFLAPSVEDNLPNTVMEALACGTPCASFDIGGISDMIEHQQNGYLAKAFEVEDLSRGIAWILEDLERHRFLCDNSRMEIENNFTLELQSYKYMSLYQQLLSDFI